jgi:hypothetical protein
MRSRASIIIATMLLFGATSLQPLHGQEPVYTTLSAGWSWPADGPVADSYNSGFTMAASFRAPVAPHILSGIEVGYSWFSLDTAKLEALNPGSTFSGGDMGLLSITSENDYVMGTPGSTMRPFINSGLGFFRSFIDDTFATTGSDTSKYSTGVYKGSFFGFHLGVGVLIRRENFGIRLDANYQYLFAGGPNLGFIPVRAGVVFYP